MEQKKYLIVVAGGRGTRMGAGIPKQFLYLDGKTILQRTIESFVQAVPDIRIITVLPSDCIDQWKDICIKDNVTCSQIIVEGGLTRYHSVKNALAKVPEASVVAVHDGVRPLVSPALIREMFSRMEEQRALVPVLPSYDTLCELELGDDGVMRETTPFRVVDRTRIFAVQTPQIFHSQDLKKAYSLAYESSFTDDASVARRYGIPISYIRGDRHNIKITAPEDLALAQCYLSGDIIR